MTEEEWKEHSEWVDTFRGKIITKYDEAGNEKKKKKTISGYYINGSKIKILYEEDRQRSF